MTADLLPKLQTHLAALGDGRDCRSDNEAATYFAAYTTTAQCLTQLRNLPADLARMTARIADEQEKVTVWLAKEAELSAATDSLSQRQLQLLHQGTLLSGPGTTYGSLGALEARVAEFTERRDRIQQQLNTWMAEAEQLLSAPAA